MEQSFDPVTDELVERVRNGYQLLRERDPGYLEFVDPQVEWTVPDSLPAGGTLKGTMEVIQFMVEVAERWEADACPEHFIADGDKLVVLGHWQVQARDTGIEDRIPFAQLQQFRDGKLVRFHNYIDGARVMRTLQPGSSL